MPCSPPRHGRRRTPVWWLVAAAALAGVVPAQALTPAEVFAKVSPSVWRIRTYDTDGLALGGGSAVVVAKDTLVTNCHVLKRAGRFVVAREGASFTGTLVLWDSERDICQVQAQNLGAPAVAIGDTSRLVVGQSVYAVGAPLGLELTLSAGLVSSLRGSGGRLAAIQTSAPISPGSSGGGLFDDEGRLVGITTASLVGTNSQNLNFAIPIDFWRELPERHQAALERGRPAGGTLAAASAAPAAATAAPTLRDPIPFLNEKRQRSLRTTHLDAQPPKACAISDNGHYGCAQGTHPTDRSLPTDPQQRALAVCARFAAKPCLIYVIDNEVVYRAPPADGGGR